MCVDKESEDGGIVYCSLKSLIQAGRPIIWILDDFG